MFYGTATGFLAYCLARGITPASTDEDVIEAALLVTSEWLDGVYRSYFPGEKVNGRSQDREWPRTGAVDAYGYVIPDGIIPVEVENATYEANIRQLANPGSLTVDFTTSKYKSVTVHGAISVDYDQSLDASYVQPNFPKVDQILYPILITDVLSGALVGKSYRV